ELVLRQREAALLLGPEAGFEAGAVGIAAAADLEPQLHEPLQGDDGPPGRGGRPQRPGARRASPRVGGQFQGPFSSGAGTPSRHGVSPRSSPRSRSNESTAIGQMGFSNLEKKSAALV